MILTWPAKDPDEVLDYSLDWSARLPAGDTIESVTWTVPAGLTRGTTQLQGSVTTAFFSAGTEGTSYDIGVRIVTAGGRTMDQTVKLKIKSR